VLSGLGPNQLLLGDRNYGTRDFLAGLAERQAF